MLVCRNDSSLFPLEFTGCSADRCSLGCSARRRGCRLSRFRRRFSNRLRDSYRVGRGRTGVNTHHHSRRANQRRRGRIHRDRFGRRASRAKPFQQRNGRCPNHPSVQLLPFLVGRKWTFHFAASVWRHDSTVGIQVERNRGRKCRRFRPRKRHVLDEEWNQPIAAVESSRASELPISRLVQWIDRSARSRRLVRRLDVATQHFRGRKRHADRKWGIRHPALRVNAVFQPGIDGLNPHELLELGLGAMKEAFPPQIIQSMPSAWGVQVVVGAERPERVEIVIADSTGSQLGISVWEVGVVEDREEMIRRAREEFSAWYSETNAGWGTELRFDAP